MSSPATQDTDDSPLKNSLDKKKLKILKNALKEERSMRTNIQKELLAACEKIEQLKQQINEKESKYLQLYQENINLQEALVRGAKSSGSNSKTKQSSVAKPQALVGNLPKKESSEKDSKHSNHNSDSIDFIMSKCKGLEEQLLKKDEEVNLYKSKLDEYEINVQKVQVIYNEKFKEIIDERDQVLNELKEKEEDFSIKKREIQESMQKQADDFASRIEKLEQENLELVAQRNHEMDRNLKIEETIDEKNDKITQLEKLLQRKSEESNLRKEVIDSLSASLMKHESDTRELAQKVALMKNQILDNDIGKALGRKYAAVRIKNLMSLKPVAFEFIQGKNGEYLLVIECRQSEKKISFERIETFAVAKDEKLSVIYFADDRQDKSVLLKKSKIYECFEIDLLIKTYQSIRNTPETIDRKGMRVASKSFVGPQKLSSQKSLSPTKKSKLGNMF